MERILPISLLSFAIAASILALPAAAARTSKAANADATQMYIGAQLGDSVVGGLLGLQINKTYSLEIRYDYFDTIYQPNTTIKANSAGIALLGRHPVQIGDLEPFFVFLKAGYERSTTKTSTYYPGVPGFPNSDTTIVTTTIRKRAVVGAGVQFDLSPSVSGRIGKNAVGSEKSVYITAIYKF